MSPRTLWAAKVALALVAMLLPLLADAAVVAYVNASDGARIELHDTREPCEGQALRAVHVTRSGERTTGCWLLRGAVVLVLFLDGDAATIPVGTLAKPAPAGASSCMRWPVRAASRRAISPWPSRPWPTPVRRCARRGSMG